MSTDFEHLQSELKSEYSLSCYDGYDEKLGKEFELETIINSNIKIKNNKLQVQRDTITNRNEIK